MLWNSFVYGFFKPLALYTWYDERKAGLAVLLQKSDGLSSLRELGMMFNLSAPLIGEGEDEHRLLQIPFSDVLHCIQEHILQSRL